MRTSDGPATVPRFRAIAVLRMSPRLMPEVRRKTGREMWLITRTTLICGPLLAFAGWWWLRDLAPTQATPGLLLRLLAASLCMPLIMSIYYVPLFSPRLGRFFLPEWGVWSKGLVLGQRQMAIWRDLSDFRVEPGPDGGDEPEIVLHATRTFRGKAYPLSLICRHVDVAPDLLEKIAHAITHKHWPDAH